MSTIEALSVTHTKPRRATRYWKDIFRAKELSLGQQEALVCHRVSDIAKRSPGGHRNRQLHSLRQESQLTTNESSFTSVHNNMLYIALCCVDLIHISLAANFSLILWKHTSYLA